MGCDNQNISLTGNSADRAALMWNVINNKILEGYEPAQFEVPKGIISMEVDTMSGMLPTKASYADPRGTVRTEIFGPNNKPTQKDDVHEWATVDSRNNLLVSEQTPEEFVTTRSFINPKSNYNPANFGNIYPRDWANRMPKTYSGLGEEEDEDEDEEKDKDKDKDKDKNKKGEKGEKPEGEEKESPPEENPEP